APLRARLLTGADGAQAVLLTLHYLAVDEWSVVPLFRDLTTAYGARTAGRAPDWEPLPVSYGDYARWAREVLGDLDDPDSRGGRQLAYWRRTLAGAPRDLALPTEARPPVPARRGSRAAGIVEFTLDERLHADVDRLAQATGTSMFMVLHAALAALLTSHGAGTDLPIGTMVAGRGDDQLADLVGCFFNTVVLRTDTAGDPSFAELLTRVRETTLSALDRQDVPFDEVVRARLNATIAAARAQETVAQARRSRHGAEELAEDATAAESDAAGMAARLEAVEATVGEDYRQIVARVTAARAERERCQTEARRATESLVRLEGHIGELRATSGQDAERREQAVAHRDVAARRFRHLCLIGLAEDAGIAPELDTADGTKATLEAARATAAKWPGIPHAPRNLGDAA
ncbi:condensation domain-containing protein, partial [Streptomyces massasporeus]